MCGIAGMSTYDRAPSMVSILNRMMTCLRHRGPDGHGIFESDNGTSGLAHTRLAIVDLSERGRQPITIGDEKTALVCNGEIYNYHELRRSLEQKGRQFYSDCDSEVILHLYEIYGERCIEHLEGMYAFALYDNTKNILFCARDPLGKKPFVYAHTSSGIAFASEIPALLDVPGVDTSIDPEAVALYLLRNLRHIPDPWTFYKGIRKLPPGHAMIIRAGQIEKCWRYWNPSFEQKTVSPEEILDQFDHAVNRRRMADVEIGALLSGGVDSTAIVDSLIRQGVTNIRTYAFGLDKSDEELARARRAAGMLKTRHREFYFNPDKQHDHFDTVLSRLGEPIMALPLTHAYALFEAIHNDGIKVVMAGHGADEIFYGYPGFNRMGLLSNFMDKAPGQLFRSFSKLLAKIPFRRSIHEAFLVMSEQAGHRKESLYKNEAAKIWPALFGADTMHCLSKDIIESWVSPWFPKNAPGSYIDEAAFLGLAQENCHAVTIAGDLPAMANSVEVRCPFLDRGVVEMALHIPYKDKVSGYRDNGNNKKILKRALASRLPNDLLYAPKRGFGYYIQEEEVLRGPWKERVDASFADFDDLSGMFNSSTIQQLKSDFDARRGVDASLIAKLYAIQRSQSLAAKSGAVS